MVRFGKALAVLAPCLAFSKKQASQFVALIYTTVVMAKRVLISFHALVLR